MWLSVLQESFVERMELKLLSEAQIIFIQVDHGDRQINTLLGLSLAWKELNVGMKTVLFRQAQSYCGRLEFKTNNHFCFIYFFSKSNDEPLKV